MQRLFFLLTLIIGASNIAQAQVSIGTELDNLDYSKPAEYEIGGIIVDGVKYLDHSVLIALSGLQVGETISIPGDKIGKAIDRLWKQGLFADVKITATRIIGNKIFLEIYLVERPRLSSFTFKGIKKGEADEIREKIKLVRGTQVTENTIKRATSTIKNYFVGKGFFNVEVNTNQNIDTTLLNHISLEFDINKNGRIKIETIEFEGNTVFKDKRLRRAMKDTKRKRWYGMFKPSKYIKTLYDGDLLKLIALYNQKGYRNARITQDTVYLTNQNLLKVNISIDEGDQFFFRDITWIGNAKYTDEQLSYSLGIKKGDVFDQQMLDERLFMAQDAVSSLYYDDGYLMFNITPVEVKIDNDSIDFEMRIVEGKQARFNKILLSGNTKTHSHVIRREIRTYPGDLFNRTNIIRTQRELAQLGYFNVEKFDVKTTPHPYDGTVDIEYVLEEEASDQIELSGGWGAGIVLVSARLTLSNLAIKDFFKKEAWHPYPAGDGQRLSLTIQTNGSYYQAYSLSFYEPWLGGRKANGLSVSVYHTIRSLGYNLVKMSEYMKVTGASVGLSLPMEWPDDYFRTNLSVSYEHYNLKDFGSYFMFSTGRSNNLYFMTSISRNSIDAPIYTRRGAIVSLSVQVTPPYSFFRTSKWWQLPDVPTTGEDGNDLTEAEIAKLETDKQNKETAERYKWIEYHKWKFKLSTFNTIIGDLVLNSKIEFGYIGFYNKTLGPSPFETFQLGGDGLSGYNFYGTELIGLRGYDNGTNNMGSLTPDRGGNVYQKMTFELRYPLSLNPSATFYVLAFAEAGNAWYSVKDYSPFEMKRSAGIGLRVYMAMLGMIGVDWGYGFDEVPNRPGANGGQFAFSIGQQF